jgi:hypothetical protein
MILLLTLCFLLTLLLPHMAVATVGIGRDQPKDVFSPLRMLTVLNLTTVPYLVLLSFDLGRLNPDIQVARWVTDVPGSIARVVAVGSAGYLVSVLGLFSPAGEWIARRLPVLHGRRFTPARCRRGFLICMGLGLLAYAYFLQQIGGLRRLWMMMALRADLLAGRGYLFNLYTLLLTFGPLILVYSLRYRMSRGRVAAVVLTVLAVGAILASTGGRSGAVTLVLYAFMTAHYGVHWFRRFLTRWTVLIGGVLFLFITVMPLFRTANAFEAYTARPSLLLSNLGSAFDRISFQMSGLDRGLVIVSYFTPERLWGGRSYIDLLSAPIPRRTFPDKPPVDEGVYVTALAIGREVRPSMPARALPSTSWPPGNWVLYMNFGVLGYLVGMYLTGIGIRASYRYMWASGFSPLSIYLYGYSVLGGVGLSNYTIIQGIVTITMAVLVFVPLFGRWLPDFGPQRAPAPALAGADGPA